MLDPAHLSGVNQGAFSHSMRVDGDGVAKAISVMISVDCTDRSGRTVGHAPALLCSASEELKTE